MNIYEKCPVLQSNTIELRLITKEDTAGLLKVYSDEKAVPLFNKDNCQDDFHYCTMERMQQAVDFWVEAYENSWFVRWTVIDSKKNEMIGTIEAFHRDSTDSFNGYGMFRLDLRSDYEKREVIADILNLLIPNMYLYFDCTKIMTKAIPEAAERIEALQAFEFVKSDQPMMGGSDGKAYMDYWVVSKACSM